MQRILLFVFLLAFAPMASQSQEQPKCLELDKVKIAAHVLHPGEDTHAELTFKTSKTGNCQLVDGPEKPIVTLEPMSGVGATAGKLQFHHHQESIAGTSAVKAKEMSVEIHLEVWSLPPGEHQVHGVINHQIVDSAGTIQPESLAFAFPFQVAPPKAQKYPSPFVEGMKTTGVVAAEIVLFPLILVFMLVYCPLSGQCPDC